MAGVARGLPTAVYVFAFVSATSALVYQVAWTRMLSLTFGRTTLAAGAVVAGFMGGMALGAGLYHRVARTRARGALRVYAGLEVGIALTTAALTALLVGLPEFFAGLAETVPSGLPMTFARIGLVFVLLLVPAAFMGATYPALCTVVIRSREGVRRHLGAIYGLNTLGAAAGAVIAGFFWIEWLGLRGSVAVANGVNVAVGVLAFVASLRLRDEGPDLAELPEDDAVLSTSLPYWLTGIVLVGSGFATLAYEIVWFRALQYLFGNSTYALTLMLAVFLLGLGIGAMLFGPIARRARPERDLALCQLAIAVLALLAIGAEARILADDDLAAALSVFAPAAAERAWGWRLLADAGVAVAMMLPATLAMGLSFPLATRLYLGDVRRLGRRVGGSVVLANVGSIAGSILAAVAILPVLGTVGGTRAIAVLNLLLGLALLCWLPGRRAMRFAFAGVAVALVVFLGTALPDRLAFRGEGRLAFVDGELLYESEGDLATVQVWESERGMRAMAIDGAVIAVGRGGFYPIDSKQVLLAHLPLTIDAEIERTLSVGLGSGTTLARLATYPSIERLDAVEISRDVVRGSGFFEEEAAALEDERVHVEVEDISHFLLRGREPYDLIVSDGKQNPDFSSNWTLMCRDFYENALARLGEDGLFVQWIPLSTIASDFRVTLRTFTSVFPETEVFLDAPHWVIAVGSPSAIAGRRRFRPENYRPLPALEDLRRLRLANREALLSTWVADGAALRDVLGPGPISTWNRSPVEFSAYKTPWEVKLQAPLENLGLLLEANARAHQAGRSPFGRAVGAWTRSTRLLWQAHRHSLEGDDETALVRARRARVVNPADRRARALEALLSPPQDRALDEEGGPTPDGRPPESGPSHPRWTVLSQCFAWEADPRRVSRLSKRAFAS